MDSTGSVLVFLAIIGAVLTLIVVIAILRADGGDGRAGSSLRRPHYRTGWIQSGQHTDSQFNIDPIMMFSDVAPNYSPNTESHQHEAGLPISDSSQQNSCASGNAVSQDLGNQDLGNQSCGGEDPGNQDFGSQSCGCQDMGSQNFGN